MRDVGYTKDSDWPHDEAVSAERLRKAREAQAKGPGERRAALDLYDDAIWYCHYCPEAYLPAGRLAAILGDDLDALAFLRFYRLISPDKKAVASIAKEIAVLEKRVALDPPLDLTPPGGKDFLVHGAKRPPTPRARSLVGDWTAANDQLSGEFPAKISVEKDALFVRYLIGGEWAEMAHAESVEYEGKVWVKWLHDLGPGTSAQLAPEFGPDGKSVVFKLPLVPSEKVAEGMAYTMTGKFTVWTVKRAKKAG
ncbi:MAG: hypothetical protein HY077_16140 [Elusimicrobia bacterium]|nr:hypothetical protein [Elusimicrobiota bacterium]